MNHRNLRTAMRFGLLPAGIAIAWMLRGQAAQVQRTRMPGSAPGNGSST